MLICTFPCQNVSYLLSFRIATELQTELFHFQRDYVSVLGQSVHRPLVDPPRESHWLVTDKEKHLSNLNDLTRFMKSENDHLLGCSIPTVGELCKCIHI